MVRSHSLTRENHLVSSFWWHFLQMLAVMVAGMVVSAVVLSVSVGARSWEEVTTQYGPQALIAMAVGMTLPMTAWMLYRGMGRRNAFEMAAVMALPVVPFLCLVWLGVTTSALCGPYCVVTGLAMLGLMAYRHRDYS